MLDFRFRKVSGEAINFTLVLSAPYNTSIDFGLLDRNELDSLIDILSEALENLEDLQEDIS